MYGFDIYIYTPYRTMKKKTDIVVFCCIAFAIHPYVYKYTSLDRYLQFKGHVQVGITQYTSIYPIPH